MEGRGFFKGFTESFVSPDHSLRPFFILTGLVEQYGITKVTGHVYVRMVFVLKAQSGSGAVNDCKKVSGFGPTTINRGLVGSARLIETEPKVITEKILLAAIKSCAPMKAVIKPKRRNVCYCSEKKQKLMIYFRGMVGLGC